LLLTPNLREMRPFLLLSKEEYPSNARGRWFVLSKSLSRTRFGKEYPSEAKGEVVGTLDFLMLF
jgi:hypothetical protein